MLAAVVLYPGCIFFEIALAVETLAPHGAIGYFTPDGADHLASNQAMLRATGSFEALRHTTVRAVLVPGGDPRSILLPESRSTLAAPALQAQAARGALIAGICAGALVMAAAGLLRGRRGTHNYTAERAPPEKVAAVAPFFAGMHHERCDCVVDGALLTAQPWAYRAYAAQVAQQLGVLSTEAAARLEHYTRERSFSGSRPSTPA